MRDQPVGENLENKWLSFAKRLHALASSGLHFTKDVYDRERYEEIVAISQQMMAELASSPVERIADLLAPGVRGYATPKVDVRGALFRRGKILLVQEKCDRLWTLPGGFAEVGRSGSENVKTEVLEEAGLEVSVEALFQVRHKSKGPNGNDLRDFYKIFYICHDVDGTKIPHPGNETLSVDFFDVDHLPELSLARTSISDILLAKEFNEGRVSTKFD